MVKVALFPVLLVAACVAAGLYGALHNQISYTVSPGYFHAFKFQQFGIPEGLPGRLGAAIVGWRASWFMGLYIGVPVLLLGLILPGPKAYLRGCLVAFAVVIGTALVVGLGALVYAGMTISVSSPPPFSDAGRLGEEVAFARASMMHNFSYLGGLIGIGTGSLYLVVERVGLFIVDRRTRVARRRVRPRWLVATAGLVAIGVGGLGYLVIPKHRLSGDSEIHDRGLLSWYPRYEVRFPSVRLDQPGDVSYHVFDPPRAALSIYLYVEGKSTAERHLFEKLTTSMEAWLLDGTGKLLCHAQGVPYAPVSQHAWILSSSPDEAVFWHRACLDMRLEARASYALRLRISNVDPATPAATLRPALVGGGIRE